MNKSILAMAAAVALLGAGGAQAQQFPPMPGTAPTPVPMWSGYMSGFFGASISQQETPSVGDTSMTFGGDARANLSFFPGIHLQVDVEGERTNGDFKCCSQVVKSYWSVGGHLSYRDPDRFSAGAFGSYIQANNLDDGNMAKYAMFGGEGQILLPGVTLYGQGGYIDLREGDEDMENTYFGRAAVRWFPEPNLKVAGEFDYVRGRLHDDIGNKVRVISWGGSVEKRFTGSMFSMFLNYNGMDMRSKSNPDDRAKDHTVVVGLRIFGNTSTLYANDRAGATYDSPNFLRYLPWVGEAD